MPSANEQRGEVDIEIGGRSWVMRPGFSAVSAIEKQTGKSLIELLQGLQSIRVTEIAIIITECIRASKVTAPPTLDIVGEWIMENGIDSFLMPAATVLQNAWTGGRKAPAPEPEEGNAEPAA